MRGKVISNIAILLLALDVALNDLNFFRVNFYNYILLFTTLLLLVENVFIIIKKEIYIYVLSIIFFLFFFVSKLVINAHFEGVFAFNIPILFKYLMYLMIGVKFFDINKNILLISIILILIGFFNLLNISTLSIDFFKLHDPYERSVLASSADILVIIYFIFIFKEKQKKQKRLKMIFQLSLTFLILFFLFVGGSRTTFILFLLSCLLVFGVKIKYIFISGVTLVVLINDQFIEFISNIDSLKEYRIIKLLSYKEDISYIARNRLFDSGLNDILENPLSGKFGGQLTSSITDETGRRWGAYIHNILSYYRQFGLIPFVFLINLLVYSSVKLFNADKKFIPILLFLLISILFSRSYSFPFIFIIFGITISFKLNNNKYLYK